MKPIEWYKENYKDPRGLENPVFHSDGTVDVPLWLLVYILKASGLKSKKQRIVKKTIKRSLVKLLSNYKDGE